MPAAHFHRVAALLLLLPWLLGGCAVYDHFFHPHRLGTPPMTAAAKAKYKAAEKARHKGLTLGAPATDGKATAVKAGDADAPAADAASAGSSADAASPEPAAEPAAEAKISGKELSNSVHNGKTKHDMVKRSFWQRLDDNSRKRHHYDLHYRGHTDVAHDARKLRKYSKHPKEKAGAADAAADASAPEPEPDPTQPAEAKPAAKPAARPAAKAKVAPRVVPKAKPAAKPAPRPAAKPAAAPAATAADEPQPEDRKNSTPAKVKKPKRDKNGNKLPKADPTQPQED